MTTPYDIFACVFIEAGGNYRPKLWFGKKKIQKIHPRKNGVCKRIRTLSGPCILIFELAPVRVRQKLYYYLAKLFSLIISVGHGQECHQDRTGVFGFILC